MVNDESPGDRWWPSRDLREQLDAARHLLRIRERELLEAKGHCSNRWCRLHSAHAGPCDEPRISENIEEDE